MAGGTVFGREPALFLGAVAAIITLAVGFGLNITGEQVALINIAVLAVTSFATRSQVTALKSG